MITGPHWFWIIALGILIAYVIRRVVGRARVDTNLLAVCLGDREQANRLIDFEMRRSPSLSRSSAAAMALARIRRDNH